MQKRQKQTKVSKVIKTYSELEPLVKKNILGVGITDASQEKVLEFVIKNLKTDQKPYYIVTPNPEMLVLARKNATFKKVLNSAKLASNDGVGLGLAARLLGTSLSERFTGVQLVEKLCEKCADWPITVGFLGAGPKIAELTAERLQRTYTGLKVTFVGQEWPEKNSQTTPVDILFVAFGAPKQEFWMAEHLGKIPVKVMVGVGGSFDYISGKIKRAPIWMQQMGLEWFFRLLLQPWRIKRQLALLTFMGMVLKEKMGGKFIDNEAKLI